MIFLQQFVHNFIEHPQTTIAGIAAIASAIGIIAADHRKALDPVVITDLLSGIALLIARDPMPKSGNAPAS